MKKFLKGALVGGIAGAFVVGGASALAGTGVGSIFNLGQPNNANAPTSLQGAVSQSPQLSVTNNGTGAALRASSTTAPALNLDVAPGVAPLRVNSGTRVTNLNADLLDGKDSTALAKG